MSILVDHEIEDYGIVSPHLPALVEQGVISYGPTSMGYDCRLGAVFRAALSGWPINPKHAQLSFEDGVFQCDHSFELQPGSFLLGVTVERFTMPDNVIGIAVGKSTYARCGLQVNVTPLEPGWEGYLTLELSNPTKNPIRIYPGEGIIQVMFFRSESVPAVTYRSRGGKYMDQPAEPILPRVKR